MAEKNKNKVNVTLTKGNTDNKNSKEIKKSDSKTIETSAKQTVDNKVVVGKYKIDCVYDDLYMYYLYANNGQLLYESREYVSKKTCINGIETFKRHMADPATTLRIDQDKNNRYKFIIKNRNSIYVGQTYSNKAQAESSAESVKRFALVSELVD